MFVFFAYFKKRKFLALSKNTHHSNPDEKNVFQGSFAVCGVHRHVYGEFEGDS